jgi:hypothetical protein
MKERVFLAPTPVSRELKGRVKAWCWDKGITESELVKRAVIELMERGAGPAEAVPDAEKENGK